MRAWVRRATYLLIALVAFAWAWNSSPINLRDRLFPKHLAEVYDGLLYRSGQIDGRLLEATLRDLGIRVIIDLTGAQRRPEQLFEQRVADQLGIEHHIFSLGGSGVGAVDQYVGAVEVMTRAIEARQPVLVHCRAGDRRTGGVVAAYQLLIRGEPVERAREEVARYSRTPVTKARVWSFLQANLDQMAEMLTERGLPVASHLSRGAMILFGEDAGLPPTGTRNGDG